jgi:hypothetical protein
MNNDIEVDEQHTIFASFKNSERACWREIAKMGDYGAQDFQETSRLRM